MPNCINYTHDETAAKIDFLTGTQAETYISSLDNLLMNACELVDVAEKKTNALWIFCNILKSIAGTTNYYNRTFAKAKEVLNNPISTSGQLDFWLQKMESLNTEKAIKILFDEYGRKYDDLLLRYTSDNLDNITTELPTADEILLNNAKPRQAANETKTKQSREALAFLLG